MDNDCDTQVDCDDEADCGGAIDCQPPCDFDSICEPALGEDCNSCPSDCNGQTSGKPANRFCCGVNEGCGDARCSEGGFVCAPDS